MTRRLQVLAMCVALVPAVVPAQGRGNPRRQQNQLPPDGAPPAQQLGRIMRLQLHLTDAQTSSLQETNNRFSQRLQALNVEERNARMTMRDGVCSGDTTRSAEVGHSLDQLVDLQKRRAQLLDDEQKELSGFLSPFQRARYLGFQERLLDAMGRGGPGGRGRLGAGRAGGPPPGGPPPNEPPPDQAGVGGRGDICAGPPARGRGADGKK